AGMFGARVHSPTSAELQPFGISPHLGRLGLNHWSRDFSAIQFKLAAIATRTEASARVACDQFHKATGHSTRPFWGETPWLQMLKEMPDLDVVSVATPDDLHTPVVVAALRSGAHVLCEKPLCQSIQEADDIIQEAQNAKRMVA